MPLPPPPPPRSGVFTEIPLATAPGLSGLATDERGGMWMVAERAHLVYRVVLDGRDRDDDDPDVDIETLEVVGVPVGFDLEGIATLGNNRFAFGTEGRMETSATVLLGDRRGDTIVVTRSITLPGERLGLPLVDNEGAEGVCGRGDTIVAAMEGVADDAGRRWAPVVVIVGDTIVRRHRLWLTTQTGKLSALDCRIGKDGSVEAIAIERHFAVTNVLRFVLPPLGKGADDVVPEVALDLGPAVDGRLNLEGIATLRDGRVVAVVDNQWKTVTGPSLLLLFHRGAVP